MLIPLPGGTIFPPGQQAREYWFLTEDEKVTITIGNSDGKPHKQWFLTEDGLYEKLDYVMDSSGQNHEGYLHSGYP